MITYHSKNDTSKSNWKVILLKFLGVFLLPILIGFLYNISQGLIIADIIFYLIAVTFFLEIILVFK